MMPFAINAATKYISPTKTPEYLAAGKPVVSTPIADVVRTYGDAGLAHIAETPERFVQGIRDALAEPAAGRLGRAQRCSRRSHGMASGPGIRATSRGHHREASEVRCGRRRYALSVGRVCATVKG